MLRSVESNTYLGENKMLIQIVLILFFISSCNSNLYEYLNSKGSIHTITNIPSKYCKDCRMEATIVTDDPYPYYHNPNIHAQINLTCNDLSRIKNMDADLLENKDILKPEKLEYFLEYKSIWKDLGNKNPSSHLKDFIEDCNDTNPIRLSIIKRYKRESLPKKLEIILKAYFMDKDYEHRELLELRLTKDNRAPIRIH
ncbi:MAG TPA: hypothetical protein PK079_15950 [Leptospiraceae bacterium]|nr:hypothetical protein [Leptospiraceae bacterium]HMX33123.1 hypothetical protein [Leptospiraceae bacterium]HMZ63072.1 hypothetical protein [Leptospiraceae bacterium]HNA09476.1 hypothetical protein [Leptospiraceae bacterium]HNE54664.1 hypothetical protein [Leptospiraceae bacterium]